MDLVGIVCWSVCGALFWFGGTIWVRLWGTSGVSCANVGASSCFPVSLERTVYPQVVSLDLVDRSSEHFYHCTLFLGYFFRYLPWLWIASSPCYLFLFAVVRLIRVGSPLGFLPGESDSPPLG